MNPIHQVWTGAVQTAFNHSANLACLQKSKVLRAATELLPSCSQSIPPQSWGAPREGGQRPNHISAGTIATHTYDNNPHAPAMGLCHVMPHTKTSEQENKSVFPASIIMGGRKGLCSGLYFKLLQPDLCLGSVLYSDPDMASAKGIHRYNKYCRRIPALRALLAQMLG